MASHDLSPEEVHWAHLVALFGDEPNGFAYDRTFGHGVRRP
jgi:hypothetical protein